MEKIFEQLFKLIDNSAIETLIKKITISEKMTPEEVNFINLLIENDKKNNFLRIKYIYVLEGLIGFGYFADKVQDRRIFKTVVSGLTQYNRKIFSKILRKYEKKSIIGIEKTFLEATRYDTGELLSIISDNPKLSEERNLYERYVQALNFLLN
jgi:hypothetical protein